MTTNNKNGLFLGGVPTEPDVKLLLEKLGTPQPQQVIGHAAISDVIAVPPTEKRYRTVTNAWRRHLLKIANVRLVAVSGVGFRVVDGRERITHDVKEFGRGTKRIRRAADDARRVDVAKLSTEDQRVTEHVIRHMDATVASLAKTSKAIAIEFSPQEQLPRGKP